MKVDFAYYIVAPRAKLNLPKVSFFIDWLRTEAGQEEHPHLAVARGHGKGTAIASPEPTAGRVVKGNIFDVRKD